MKPCDLFSTCSSIEEAIAFSTVLILALPLEHRAAATTAMWVPVNTLLVQLETENMRNYTLAQTGLPKTTIEKATRQELFQFVRTLLPRLVLTGKALEDTPLEPIIMLTAMALTHLFEIPLAELTKELIAIEEGRNTPSTCPPRSSTH